MKPDTIKMNCMSILRINICNLLRLLCFMVKLFNSGQPGGLTQFNSSITLIRFRYLLQLNYQLLCLTQMIITGKRFINITLTNYEKRY